MRRLLSLLCLLLASADPVCAQQDRSPAAMQLRGSGDDYLGLSGDPLDGDEAPDPLMQIDPVVRPPLTVAPTAVPGPTRPAGRVQPVAPLSTGTVPARGWIEDEDFAGDTTRDAPRGLRLGRFLLFPELTLRGGASSNISNVPGAAYGRFYRIAPGLRVTSDWSRHHVEASLRGSLLAYLEGGATDEVSAELDSLVRFDASELTRIEGRATYSIAPESSASPENTDSGTTLVHGLGSSLAVTRDVGRIAATLRGALSATAYSSSGGRDNLVASATARLGYGLRETVSPFVEATVLTRLYEGGGGRSSIGYALRSGVAFDGGPKLSGEIGAGWRLEDLRGSSYKNLQGILLDANLTWSPNRLTRVRLEGSTAFEASALNGASGSVLYSGELSVAQSLSDAVALELAGGVDWRSYQGVILDELTVNGRATATWAITDVAALQARYSYKRVDSSQPGRDYDSHAIEAGIRLRR